MKHKKLFSILASAVMAMAIAAPSFAFADEDDPPATGFSNDSTATLILENAKAGDTFTAYKLIDIAYNATDNSISYSWDTQISGCINGIYQRSEISDPNITDFKVEDYIALPTESRKMLLASLFNHIHDKNAHSEDPTTGHVIKGITVDGFAGSGVEVKADDENKATWTNVSMGGYFIEPVETTDVYEFIFKAVQPTADANGNYTLKNGEISISTKHNPVGIQKFTNIPGATHSSGTIEAGNEITYYIFADVPKYGMNALQKSFSIKDDIPEGITIDEDSITVKANATNTIDPANAGWVTMAKEATYTLTSTAAVNHTKDFTVSIENTDDNKQFDMWYKYTIDGEGKYQASPNYAKILITYTAKLNENAVLTEKTTNSEGETVWKGNKNTATLTYMPFPYIQDEDGKITTNSVSDPFTVYTYGLEVWKYDGNTGLSGAHFKLYSTDSDASKADEVTGVFYKTSLSDTSWTEVTAGTDLVTKNGYLYIKGLKGDTNYILEETKAPAEYNLPAEDAREKTIFTETLSDSVGLEAIESVEAVIANAAEKGFVYQAIENNKGFTLPETGGTGVMILKILGIVAMAVAVIVVAVVLLHPKKKATDK